MSDHIKNKVVVVIMGILFFGLSITCLLKPAQDISMSERRPLQQFPSVSVDSLLSASFMNQFDEYAVDQFPMRDKFRSLYAWSTMDILHKKDNQGNYVAEGHASKIEYPMNQNSLDHVEEVFDKIYERYLKGNDHAIYFSIIPDKNYFLAEKNGILSMDYSLFYDEMIKKMDQMTFIDIRNLLELDDYYRTDPHWRQEKIVDVAKLIVEKMGGSLSSTYTENKLDVPFCGVYCGQSAMKLEEETLYYLTNDIMDECIVYDHENDRQISMVDMEKAQRDPYELFLSGSLSYITIENPNALEERELIVFRDSFGSSLVPLLSEAYSKITLLDIRYIQSERLGNLIEFDDQDVLFLYSTMVLNNSETLK